MGIIIDATLRVAAPELVIGAARANVANTTHNPELWDEINQRAAEIASSMSITSLADLPQIKALRSSFNTLGKDPSRYRGSQEALLRRILQGKPLQPINTVVDINNLLSLESCHSVGSYDAARISSSVTFRIGLEGETYKGIGKNLINLDRLPVFCDDHGPFGSPTSDSERAMITPDAKHVLMLIIAFSGPAELERHLARAARLLEKYARADREEMTIDIFD
jgi:DNA/RNA-binding domain of Phe-tRNA-synthetase-like protein